MALHSFQVSTLLSDFQLAFSTTTPWQYNETFVFLMLCCGVPGPH